MNLGIGDASGFDFAHHRHRVHDLIRSSLVESVTVAVKRYNDATGHKVYKNRVHEWIRGFLALLVCHQPGL